MLFNFKKIWNSWICHFVTREYHADWSQLKDEGKIHNHYPVGNKETQ